jgi:hypothetical protein
MKCNSCGHEHSGAALAYICIGCPCSETPGCRKDDAPALDRKELACESGRPECGADEQGWPCSLKLGHWGRHEAWATKPDQLCMAWDRALRGTK